jgi:hypothetical protein
MKTPSLFAAAALAAAFLFVVPARAQLTWPKQAPSPAGEVTIYQPQIDSYSGNQLTAHAAVSVARSGGKPPLFGAVFFMATLSTDRGTDTAVVENIAVTNARFPSKSSNVAGAVSQAISEAGSLGTLVLSQTQLLAQLALTQKEESAAANFNNTPPQILFATEPSVLVSIAGQPKLVQASGSNLLTVVNSPFFIALDPSTRLYYLNGGGQWLSTSNILKGPWTPAANVPDAVTALAAKQETAQQQQNAASTDAGGPPPQILVATQPTELIQTAGPAEYAPIEGTDLLYISNTDSDVFMDIDTQALYVLLSGRWFTAPTQAGPWTYVPPSNLPGDFARIPAGLPVSNALASVPGTQAAQDATLDAQVPQTAAIQRNAPPPTVAYDGKPKFQPVEKNSSVSYAVNTTSAVAQVGGAYYVCSDGVWYQASAPLGPWIVSVEVPQVIYTIPPTCPIYPVTFCRIYSSTPDVVYCGYLPGYTGSYIVGGAVVFGTGWPYNPWFGNVFIPRPVTWGFGATFSTGWGCWGFGVGAGWGAASFGCSWNSGWWGCGNYHWNNWNWNSNWNQNVNVTRNVTNNITNNDNRTVNRTVNNLYRNNPDRLTPQERQRLQDNENRLARQEHSLQNQIDRDRQDGAAAAERQRALDQQQKNRDEAQQRVDRQKLRNDHRDANRPLPTAEHPRDDVYADHDGNVYRHDDRQGWQRREDNAWHRPNDRDENFQRNRSDLNRQFAARARGNYGGGREARGGGGGRRR